jgi:transcriptional regulator
MHPNPAFEWTSSAEMLQFVSEHPFAHIFTSDEDGLHVVHAPVVIAESGKAWFHVSRRNRVADHIAGRRLLISVLGRHAYHSANWYVSENQVSTWHYEAVEIGGDARQMTEAELVTFLDRLSDRMEGQYSPQQPWTRDKMEPGKFEAMTKAIVGFEVTPISIRGMRKFNQHKTGADLEASIEGQRGAGRDDIAAAMHELTTGK